MDELVMTNRIAASATKRSHPLITRSLTLGVVVAASLAAHAGAVDSHPPARNEWVYFDHSGKLAYRALPAGDRILDFSYAGYMGGGVALPSFPVKKTVAPSGEDDSAAIQTAIDEVSKLPLVNGVRGAVLLKPGHFRCKDTLSILTSGVALRGSGPAETDTLIELTGDPHLAISILGKRELNRLGAATTVADAYVPAGTMSLHVQNASGFNAGDTVEIVKPATEEWVHFMGMDTLVRGGKKETWVGSDIKIERRIAAVKDKMLVFDVPIADSYDAKYLGANGTTVTKVSDTGQIEQVGVENLRILAPARKVTLNDKHFNGIEMKSVQDGWIRNLRILNTTGPVNLDRDTRRVTVQQVDVTQSIALVGAAKSADFSVDGTQILIDRCTATEDNVFYIATGARQQGPNVILHCVFHGDGHIQPHQRWSTALLVDGTEVPEGGIDLMNRGEMGSGHGWTMGWGVAWNNVAKSYVIQMPPGSANWGIGNRGEQRLEKMPTFDPGPELSMLPQGIIDSPDKPIVPASLYLEQLKERLGLKALKNIGY
jgi:hypothetical protein